jgi:RimJ/RimL family protein N-acetyltransferase
MNGLKSKTVHLRYAETEDAEFIYSLRVNDTLNQHISKVSGTVETQANWLTEYKKREKDGKEYYFIIIRNDTNEKIGTVRVYGITDDNRFCWGSWILNENKTKSAAIESACIIYKFSFEYKKFKASYFQVDKNNKSVLSFHLKTGARILSEDNVNLNFTFELEDYLKLKSKYSKYLEA